MSHAIDCRVEAAQTQKHIMVIRGPAIPPEEIKQRRGERRANAVTNMKDYLSTQG